jgi:cell division initiation protein
VLTPQEVKGRVFERAVLNGYDRGAVDDFIQIVADDYASLYKENNALKAKMKALADKLEEFQGTEDAMRKALVAAQKVAKELEDDAHAKYESMIEQAEESVRSRIEELKIDVHEQEERFEAARERTAQFTAAAQLLVAEYGSFLERINSLPFAEKQMHIVQQQQVASVIKDSAEREIELEERRAEADTAASSEPVNNGDTDTKIYLSGNPNRQKPQITAAQFDA